MKNLTRILALITVMSLSMPAFADYLPSEESGEEQISSHERVLGFLKSDQFVMSRHELRQHTDDVVRDLIRIAKNARHDDKLRSRAIQALALYRGDDRAPKAMLSLMKSVSPRAKLFPAVLLSYAQLEGEKAVPHISNFLNHSDSDIRRVAVIALGRFGGQDGFDQLLEYRGEENDRSVRAKIDHYVK